MSQAITSAQNAAKKLAKSLSDLENNTSEWKKKIGQYYKVYGKMTFVKTMTKIINDLLDVYDDMILDYHYTYFTLREKKRLHQLQKRLEHLGEYTDFKHLFEHVMDEQENYDEDLCPYLLSIDL